MHIFKDKKGFTLIELMVVIAIIGILLGVIVSSISKNKEKARDNARITQMQQAQLALEEYKGINRQYPPAFNASNMSQSGAKYLPSDFPFTLFKYVPFKSSPAAASVADYHLGIVMEANQPILSDCRLDRDDYVLSGATTRLVCGQVKPVLPHISSRGRLNLTAHHQPVPARPLVQTSVSMSPQT
jgi:prepilin-type N-terminal cleavage/methylation domain-containing protein